MLLEVDDRGVRDGKTIVGKAERDVWTIWYAAEHGHADQVRGLLDRQMIHVNAREPRMQWTALHLAARHAQDDVIGVLLAFRANVDLVDKDGNTPLHLCAGYGSFKSCVRLLEGGADTQCLNHAKLTALDVAVKMDHRDVVQLLQSWVPVEMTAAQRREKQRRVQAFVTDDDRALQQEPEAIYLQLRALRAKEAALGPTHPGIVANLSKLSKLYKAECRPDDALDAMRRAVDVQTLHAVANDLNLAILRNNLAALLFAYRDRWPNAVEESVALLQQSLAVFSAVTGSSHVDYAMCLENLCICLKYSSQLALADGFMLELLAQFHDTFGMQHEKVLGLQLSLASKYIAQKRFQEGLALYATCLDITTKKYGQLDVAVAHCHDYIGRAYFVMGDFKMAEQALRASLAVLLALYDASHDQVIRGHNNLAVVAIAQQDASVIRARLSSL
ncbi:hypothetical protein AC1031_020117 [Aphanomyces cochlioides]|nr:hypothetical protein AC1031_020117 [Aphanomyces cochlioides]